MMISAAPGFHFANHASVSLRTPGLVFRSLGVLTIAAVPIAPDNATNVSLAGRITPSASEKGEATLAGNWFVGVFGKWWLGGMLRLRQQNTSSEKDDPFTAGVLCIRALDAFDCDIVSESEHISFFQAFGAIILPGILIFVSEFCIASRCEIAHGFHLCHHRQVEKSHRKQRVRSQ